MRTYTSTKQRINFSATEPAGIRNIMRLGFASVLGLIFCLGILGLIQLHSSKSGMINIVELGDEKISLAIKMRDAIWLRALIIQRMRATDDFFRRDEKLKQFDEYSGAYQRAQDALSKMAMTAEETQLLETLSRLTRFAHPMNREAAEMLLRDPLPAEFNVVLENAVSTQQQLLQILDQFIELQKTYGKSTVTAAQEEFRSTLMLMVVLLAILLLIGTVIARRVTRLVISTNSELEVKNKELEAAWFEAANATHAKSKFLANMSHEIRTPLTSIIGFAETLTEPNQSQDDLQHAADSIKQSGKHLSQIISDVLDVSKIEAGQIEMEMISVSPTETVSEVASMMEEKIKKKGLKFRANFYFPLPKVIVADPTRLRQILLNLLANAAKFTSEGIICINTYYLPDERLMKYEVSDTGIGMAPEGAAKVFEPFSQAEKSTTRKFGGTGLGLSISKQLAEIMGGDIVCETKLGEGTTFTVTISIGEIHEPELIYEMEEKLERPLSLIEKQERKQFSGRVLLAEDTLENQKLIALHLRKSGVEVTVVENGKQAVDTALEKDFDLILMDMQMPVLSGVDATRMLRVGGYAGPIVALTANTSQSDRNKCMAAGVNDFLNKPLDFVRFDAVLQTHLVNTGKAAAPAQLSAHPSAQRNLQPHGAALSEDAELEALYNSFLVRLPGMIESIKLSTQQKDWQALESVSHQLKGLGGSFGYPRLTAVCKHIQDNVRCHVYDNLDALVAELEQEYRLMQPGSLSKRKAV